MRSTTTFEKKAAPEFYDTCEEQSRVAAAPVDQTLRRLEIKRSMKKRPKGGTVQGRMKETQQP